MRGALVAIATAVLLGTLAVAALGQTIASTEKQARWQACVPLLDDVELLEKIRSAQYSYSESERPRVIQMRSGVHHVSYNLSGGLDPTANANEFPWQAAGGHHLSNTLRGKDSCRLIWLPESAGKPEPIVWWRELSGERFNASDGRYHTAVRWCFPAGATVIEMLGIRGDAGTYVLEIREREKLSDGTWRFGVHQRWGDLDELNADLEERGHKPISVTQERYTVRDTHAVRLFGDTTYTQDVVPQLDPEIVHELLTEVPLSDKFGSTWNATTASKFNVVPHRNRSFVTSESCVRCHNTASSAVARLNQNRDWYGTVPGADGIFSFHPFSFSSISYTGVVKRTYIDPDLERLGIVAKFDRQKHSRYVRTKYYKGQAPTSQAVSQ